MMTTEEKKQFGHDLGEVYAALADTEHKAAMDRIMKTVGGLLVAGMDAINKNLDRERNNGS